MGRKQDLFGGPDNEPEFYILPLSIIIVVDIQYMQGMMFSAYILA